MIYINTKSTWLFAKNKRSSTGNNDSNVDTKITMKYGSKANLSRRPYVHQYASVNGLGK